MLGSVAGLQPQTQLQQQQQQQQQLQQQNPQSSIPPPPPPPSNGQDINLSNILHFLQSEWRRYERDRNEWEIERAEMRARIALLEGERRSFENTKIDLLRRIKMLEYALRMERSKQLTQATAHSVPSSKMANLQYQSNTSANKDDTGSHRAGSSGSSPRSEDAPLPSENRMSITSLAALPNGAATTNKAQTWGGSNWQSGPNGNMSTSIPLAKPALGRDPKSRARSREYLKQCLQEISYLTSPQAMNPLPNRPLLNNSNMSLALPNVPPFDMAYNGRPRKMVPEVGKDFPVLNGMSMTAGASNAPIMSGSQMNLVDRDSRLNVNNGIPLHHPHPSAQNNQNQPPGFQQQPTQIAEAQYQQLDNQRESEESLEPQIPTAIFRPDDTWREQLRIAHETQERTRMNRFGPNLASSSLASWEGQNRDEEDLAKDDDAEVEDEETSSTSENGGKIWKPRKTLRNHLDAVRALAFHPSELCLATGGDDCTIKIWRTEAATLASTANRATDEIEPQLTLRGHTGPITRLVQSSSKRILYSASLDSSIRVWTMPSSSHTTYAPYDYAHSVAELVGHTDAIWDMALVRDESLLISCGAEGAVKVWQVGGGTGSNSLKLSWGYNGLDSDDSDFPEECGATSLEAIKSDLKQVAVAYQTGVIKIFDIDNGKLIMKLNEENNTVIDDSPAVQINAMVSHPTIAMLITAGEDRHIRIYDLLTGQCTHAMAAHTDAVTSLSIDAAGFSLVSGGHDCSIRFWDLLGSRACIQELTSHREKAEEGVLAVEFHPSLPVMASAGADGVVKLYASS